jgi:hypothetical protein
MSNPRKQQIKNERKFFAQASVSSEDHFFFKKYPFVETLDFFQLAFVTISTVHEFGAQKYSFYSWQNNPEGSDSLLADSLNATLRHLLQLRTGNIYNDSGINHMAHILTRGGSMALTRYYRAISGQWKYHREKTREEVSHIREALAPIEEFPVYFDQITPETRISALKYDPNLVATSKEGMLDIMDECLIRTAIHPPVGVIDLYNQIFPIDIFFWNATAYLHHIPDLKSTLKAYLTSLEETTCPSSQISESTSDQSQNGNPKIQSSSQEKLLSTKVLLT